jgi:hypothetical protein
MVTKLVLASISFVLTLIITTTGVSQSVPPTAAPSQTPTPLPSEPPSPLSGNTPDQQLFFCTTRIEARTLDGKKTSVGTGFVFAEKIDEQRTVPLIVTCKHVVEGCDEATITFVRDKDGRPDLGQKCQVMLSDLPKFVFADPDPKIDVALIPLAPILNYFQAQKEVPFFRALDKSLVPSDDAARDLSAVQAILFVGYPIGLRDDKNFTPIARRGFTATPYALDFNGLPAFLLDASVFPGSSGSPVLVLDQGAFVSKGNVTFGGRCQRA